MEREEGERARGRAAIGVTPRCSQTLPPDNAGDSFMAPGAAPGRPTRIRLPHERPFRLGPAGVCEIDSDASVRPAAAELVLYALHNTLPLTLVPPDRTPHPKRDNPASPWRPYHPRNCSPAHASTNPFISTFQLMVHNAGLHTDKCTRTRARCGASIVRQRVAAFA